MDPIPSEKQNGNIGNLDAICPYCNIQLRKFPLAKTKCKNCENYIYSLTRPLDEQKVLLTEMDAELVRVQWATINGTLEQYLEEKREREAARERLLGILGREPKKYEIHYEYLKKIIPERREKKRQEYIRNGIREWEWVAAQQDLTCDYCLSMHGKRFPVDIPFETLNHCTNDVFGYCRCTLIAVISASIEC